MHYHIFHELNLKIMSHNCQPGSLLLQTYQYSSLVLCNRLGARKEQIIKEQYDIMYISYILWI